jgi:hypothetical protein
VRENNFFGPKLELREGRRASCALRKAGQNNPEVD